MIYYARHRILHQYAVIADDFGDKLLSLVVLVLEADHTAWTKVEGYQRGDVDNVGSDSGASLPVPETLQPAKAS